MGEWGEDILAEATVSSLPITPRKQLAGHQDQDGMVWRKGIRDRRTCLRVLVVIVHIGFMGGMVQHVKTEIADSRYVLCMSTKTQ